MKGENVHKRKDITFTLILLQRVIILLSLILIGSVLISVIIPVFYLLELQPKTLLEQN